MNRSVILLLLAVIAPGCRSPGSMAKETLVAPADWIAWQAKRQESVAGTNGWTTLVGRYWLQEGQNFTGSDSTNHAVLPRGRAAASIGSFVRTGHAVRFEAALNVVATIDGKVVRTADLQSDASNAPTRLQVGSLSIVVIERGERIGLRVRDPEAPARVHFRGISWFAYNRAWRIEGRFEPSTTPRTLRVQDIIGGTQEFPSPGAVVFIHGGAEHRLDVVEEPAVDDYFVIFRDRTAGDTTYEAGRFLYVPKADPSGRVVIDFNRAYTPPCGFTPFTTCPLPPRQNWLPFAVCAGERKPAETN